MFNKIAQANAGDSRSVISTGGQSKALSYDHKPADPKENQRIVNAGGFVEFGRVNGKEGRFFYQNADMSVANIANR